MYDWQVKAPIVLIIFKRPPRNLQTVFESNSSNKTPQVLLVADGHVRIGLEDKECAAARILTK